MYEFLKQLMAIDTSLTIEINHALRSPLMDKVMWEISENWLILIVLLTGIVFLYRYYSLKKILIQIGIIIIAMGLVDVIVSRIFKPGFARLRPSHNPDLENIMITIYDYVGGTFGFVSGHAATNAVAVGLFILFLRQKTTTIYFYLIWVVLVAYSRIYLGVHYLGDVCFGILFGFLMSFIFYQIITRVSLFRYNNYL